MNQHAHCYDTNFGNDYATLIADVKKVNPKARIVAMNLPNFALIPVGTTQPAAVQAALTQFSVGFDVNVINKLAAGGIPVIDLLCDPRSYLASNFSADGFHPNDAGYAIIASEMEPALVTGIAPAPATSCSQMAAPAGATGKLLNGSERFVPPKP